MILHVQQYGDDDGGIWYDDDAEHEDADDDGWCMFMT